MYTLDSLYKRFDDCPLCRLSNNSLLHILGAGKSKNPKIALVFINPTHLNISSDPDWRGRRFPFIGVTRFWQILLDSGWIAKEIVSAIKRSGWSIDASTMLDSDLVKGGIYITNLVKCTFPYGDYPERNYFDYHLPLFKKELSIIKPKAIVSFGGLTTRYLTGKDLVLKNFFNNPKSLTYRDIPVYPCYFPVGRGNPKLATEVLGKLKYLLE